MSVPAFLLRRAGGLLLVLFVTSFIVFGLMYLAPGSPLSFVLGPRGGTPEQIAAVTAQYHLNDPFIVRYFAWLGDLFQGNLGDSIVYRQPVGDLIAGRVGTTVALIAFATVIIAIVGIGLGLLASLKGGWLDTVITTLSTLGLATPTFVIGVALISLFAVGTGWFPTNGSGGGGFDSIWHLTLPAIALAVASAAYLARITRASVLEEEGREHVQTAVARGLRSPLIIRRHVLRNALIPITTVMGLTVATLIAGAVVVESVFALDGLGSLLVRAILQRDFAVVQAVVLVLVVAFVVINAIVDFLYTLIDPRIQLGSKQ
ncbi:ABC transporter permease [Leucobacter sp. OLJS4]|uniref:ABC transporter permease n=1 Tax=unclassified Leucobacter TaxID=2621730 RepID=UPI000C17E7D7|nr:MULTISPECIES: ABC transporter permease [unclassified Leucobacter]PII82386.1 ABC transporter permease [Leucobacter sp. OLCALW19]PII87433.1 ABC transporter permease [Leucobacter sp. OLTLW20]PII94510.1 ABC transporter permease [Leucobacter sp. OLAS13]PIJ00691.1 ABC transporter permease [Leucobacter sp. OLDS2]PIJ01343.1 ABC transporter permease [Leucobacter sp. OLCS4]